MHAIVSVVLSVRPARLGRAWWTYFRNLPSRLPSEGLEWILLHLHVDFLVREERAFCCNYKFVGFQIRD